MTEEDASLVGEIVGLLQEARCEIRALSELLLDRKIVSEDELAQRIAAVKKEEFSGLKEEALRRSFEKILKTRPKQ